MYRATKIQILYSLILAGLLLGFNLFMLMGASGLDTTVTSFVVTAYIVFVPLVSLLFGNKIKRCQIVGITIVLFCPVLSMGVNLTGFANSHILYLVVADVFFAISIVLLEKISARMNPAVLVLGELFFGSIFALAGWALGVGGGIIVGGRILEGADGAAGEIGHINVRDDEAESCGCGNKGCLEQYASATGIVRMAERALETGACGSRLEDYGKLTAERIFSLAAQKDTLAVALVEEYCKILGRAMA